jgi:hypothetical protein
MRDLVDLLRKSVATTLPVVVETFDSNADPVATLSADATPAAGEKVVVLRIKAQSSIGAVDSLGLASKQYGPHVIQICTELNYAATTDNVADILTPVELLPVLIECGRRGAKVEWYQTANGTVPSAAAMTSGNLKATWNDLYNANKSV